MSKEKVRAKAFDNAGKESAEVLTEQSIPSRITTEEQAIALVKSEYVIPEGMALILVTEDRTVFYQANETPAVNHAQKNNLKLFRLQWDLVK